MMKSLFAVFLLVLVSGLPCWCRVRDGELNFVVLGDWGGQPTTPYTTPTEQEVAAQMGKTAAAVGSKFTLALGDNFYDTGVKDVGDPRFQETFEVGSAAAGTGNTHVEFIFSECVHGRSSAEPLVRCVWKPRPLWQCVGRSGIHQDISAMVHA